MSVLVLYSAGENAKNALSILQNSGFKPECFCDTDVSKQNNYYLGLPVLSIADVKSKYSYFKVFVTLPEPACYEEIMRLIHEGIFLEEQIVNERKEKYVSCNELENGLVAYSNGLKHCCDLGDKNNLQPFMKYEKDLKDIDTFVARFVEQKIQIINDNKNGKHTFCTNCKHLKEGYWSMNKKIKQVNLSLDYSCNLKCNYCYKSGENYKLENKIEVIDLINTFKACHLIDSKCSILYSSGEITIQPNIHQILESLQEEDICFFSNATRYNTKLHEKIKNSSTFIVISLDCGTKETYKNIKGVDLFDTVCENIRKYSLDGGNVILKYIITEENSNKNDLNGFIDLCLESNIKNIRISRDLNTPEVSEKVKNAAAKLAYKAYKKNISYTMYWSMV